MKDQIDGTSMNGYKGEQVPCVNDSYQLDHVVEQTNIGVSLPFPDMESLERNRRAKTREAMEVYFYDFEYYFSSNVFFLDYEKVLGVILVKSVIVTKRMRNSLPDR